ncbi:hypothetical protein N7495_002236 [Penicillium taxi]|uniref:uncharacterized protein n=1 Tax=Penicillium taxi TaxID=168475 RepID=UPI0025451AB9|nr:uncharacterized protein N7495_002236 [Penicillium taxi]KAJ5901708.1 hypothetical protein N7495_002236 [Penicillium taxi]
MADISPNKRRRMNAESVLSRPFKSPLRRPVPPASSCEVLPSTEVSTVPVTANDAVASTSTSSTVDKKPISRPFLPMLKKQPSIDPEMKELQNEKRELDALLRKTQEDLDMAQQALKIRSSNKVAELQEEIVKWRRIAHNVADEVFENAQERVSKMGGIAAWKKQNKPNASSGFGSWGFDDDQLKQDLAGNGEQDVDISDQTHEEEKEEENENEEFNMGYMLKTLNIDPKAIGYDVAGDKWIRD